MRDEFKNTFTKAVHQIVEGMCQRRTDLKITEVESDSALVITIFPHAHDTRLLVGKAGRTIKALEFLAEHAGVLANKRYFLSLEDSYVGKVGEDVRPPANPDFDVDALKRLVSQWTGLVFRDRVGMEFRIEGGEIKVYLTPKEDRSDNVMVIRALDTLFFQYGIGNGCVVKIKPPMNGD